MDALFYPVALPVQNLRWLVQGAANVADLGLDVLAFAEPPAPLDRELAVPLLPGMDEVVVTEARLRLRSRARAQEITTWSATTPTTEHGVVVALATPGRLRKIVIDDPVFPGGRPANDLHLVVRIATPKPAGGFTLGPPIFADPSFTLSAMYPAILGGLTVTGGGGRQQLAFPSTSGSAWLLQYAVGTDAASLIAVNFTTVVRSVTIDAAPSDVEVVLAADGDDEELVLWSHPGPLLPEVGEQDVSFTPLAQRRLSARLAGATGETLPVSLDFRSATAGDLVVVETALRAEYRVQPLASDPLTVALGGGWVDLTLSAPAGRSPTKGTLHAAVRHLGRERNAGSPEPPRALPSAGVRVDADRWAAVTVPVAPLGTGPAPLVSARLLLAASAPAEAVVELRGGGAGGPGPALSASVVAQLAPGAAGWIEFELAAALEVPPAALWIVLRATRGSVRWFARADGAQDGRSSLDHGASWGELEPSLGPTGAPLGLLLHRVDGELPLPRLRLELAGARVSDDLLAGAERTGPATFALPELGVPAPVLAALAAPAPDARADTSLTLFSDAVAELTLSGAALTYNPFGG